GILLVDGHQDQAGRLDQGPTQGVRGLLVPAHPVVPEGPLDLDGHPGLPDQEVDLSVAAGLELRHPYPVVEVDARLQPQGGECPPDSPLRSGTGPVRGRVPGRFDPFPPSQLPQSVAGDGGLGHVPPVRGLDAWDAGELGPGNAGAARHLDRPPYTSMTETAARPREPGLPSKWESPPSWASWSREMTTRRGPPGSSA